MLGIGFITGLTVGAGSAYLYLSRTQQLVTTAPTPSRSTTPTPSTDTTNPTDPTVFRFHPALKYGAPTTDHVRFYSGFVSSFDSRTRNPKWVIEHLTRESVTGSANRSTSDFFEDTTIEPRFRSKLADFRGSGYDRGHLAPAANHKGSQQAMNDTFTMCNMSPQVGSGFNRDYWARFEKFVKDVVFKADEVFVVTGPLWVPTERAQNGKWITTYPNIGSGPGLVAVPNFFYKVVLADATSGKHGPPRMAVGAFVMPNAPIAADTPLSAFVVPLELVETVAGMKFFPGCVSDSKRKAVDSAAVGFLQAGRKLLPAAGEQLLLPGVQDAQVGGTGLLASLGVSGGEGLVHLCEHAACKLPAEKFWEAGGKS